MKTALVLGAGGFIGSHMVKRLRDDGYWVRGVDLNAPEFSKTTKLSLALVIFKFATFAPAISINTFSLVYVLMVSIQTLILVMVLLFMFI